MDCSKRKTIEAMADKITSDTTTDASGAALSKIDMALDSIIAALADIEECIPKIEPRSVPQRAAKDILQETLDQALKPYVLDMVNSMSMFETKNVGGK